MTWDAAWDAVWKSRIGALYPSEELVRFIANHYYGIGEKKVSKLKVLDLGCGTGNHCVFLAREGFNVFGCDGSITALETAKGRLAFEMLPANLTKADLCSLPYPSKFFDLVIDIASIQHNRFKDIFKIFNEVYRVLKPGGRVFSLLRSSKDYLYKQGDKIESHTFTNIKEGDLKGVGTVHFFHQDEIKFLLKIFNNVRIRKVERELDTDKMVVHWVAEAEK